MSLTLSCSKYFCHHKFGKEIKKSDKTVYLEPDKVFHVEFANKF